MTFISAICFAAKQTSADKSGGAVVRKPAGGRGWWNPKQDYIAASNWAARFFLEAHICIWTRAYLLKNK
jgi:hypothetical protein